MNLSETLAKLREPFPADAHVERDLKGGGKWFFVPWQRIRERLDEVCPEWQIAYDEPKYLDKYCIVKAKLTLAGISREAWGNAEIEQLSSSGKDMSRGTPIERAIADCFKNCCEAFGVGAYLDEQSQDKRNFTIRYMQSKGDGRGLSFARQNEWIDGSLATASESRERGYQEQERRQVKTPISDAQRKRLWAIAKSEGQFTEGGFKRMIEGFGFSSSKLITTDRYSEICKRAADPTQAEIYNKEPQPEIVS